ncbi:hypothetical protein Fot_31582 [Forsythia ovata]|uniref:Uncharacterized protein n=1 Tax=Forsythia ovata TaxID=205694 RepID=A0ABD1T5S2_9LAMI
MENADSQQLNPTCSSNAFSRGLSIQSCMQGTLDVPTHDRMIDVPPNMVLPQNSNVPQALNGMIVEREPLYAGSLPFNFSPHSSFFETCPMMVDANVSSFTNVESNTQPLNGTVLNDDAYSFGFLEQIPQNFGLSELAADYSGDMDALHSLY